MRMAPGHGADLVARKLSGEVALGKPASRVGDRAKRAPDRTGELPVSRKRSDESDVPVASRLTVAKSHYCISNGGELDCLPQLPPMPPLHPAPRALRIS